MASSSFIIDQLWQGTSGQAPWQRKRGTVKRGKNIRFDLRVGGAVKRNPLELIARLDEDPSTDLEPTELFYWTHIRGAIVAIAAGGSMSSPVLGWDIAGNPLQVIDETNPTDGFNEYMSTATDIFHDIDVASKRDTLIVSNRLRDMGDVLDSAFDYDESLRYLRDGDPDSGTAPPSNGQVGKKTFFSDLEDVPTPSDGDVWKVVSDENLDPAGYYMFFGSTPHADYEDGYFPQHSEWFRVPKTNDPLGRYDATKMPHRIVYNEDAGTLTISTINWRQRVTGNRHTVEPMPWAKKGETPGEFHIKSVEFFQGRLLLVSEEHITGSRREDYFNLWVDNVSAVSDSDRVVVNLTQSEVGNMLRATQVGGALFLLAEHGQLEFGAGSDALTNDNGRISVITDLPSLDIRPASGPGVVNCMDAYGDAHQYTWGAVEPKSLIYTGLLTAHIPDLFHGVTAQRLLVFSNTMVVLSAEANAQVHDSFFIRGAAIQSAWSELETIDDVVYVHAWEGRVRLVTHRDTTDADYTLLHYLHRTAPAPEGMLYVPRMDRLELVPASLISYDEETDETTIPHTDREGDLDRTMMVTTTPSNLHEFVKPKRIDDNGDPVFAGDVAEGLDQYIGFVWDSELELSELYVDKIADDIMTERIAVFHFETTDYVVEWQPFPDAPFGSVEFQSHRVGLAVVGAPSLETRYKDTDLIGDPRTMLVRIKSSTPGQFAIVALEYVLQQQGRGGA